MIKGCQRTSPGVLPVILASQHVHNIGGRLCVDANGRASVHNNSTSCIRPPAQDNNTHFTYCIHHVVLLVLTGQNSAAVLSQNRCKDVVRCFSGCTYVNVCCGSVVLLFLEIKLLCGNCTEPHIYGVVKIASKGCFFLLAPLCLLLAQICPPPPRCFHTLLCLCVRLCLLGLCVHKHSKIASKQTTSSSWLGIEPLLFKSNLPGPSEAERQ